MDDYNIVMPPVQVADRHPDTGHVVDGYHVTGKCNTTGATARIFLPHDQYSPENVDLRMRHELVKHREVMALGSPKTEGQNK